MNFFSGSSRAIGYKKESTPPSRKKQLGLLYGDSESADEIHEKFTADQVDSVKKLLKDLFL